MEIYGLSLGQSVDYVKTLFPGLEVKERGPNQVYLIAEIPRSEVPVFSGYIRIDFFKDSLFSIWFFPDELKGAPERVFEGALSDADLRQILDLQRIQFNDTQVEIRQDAAGDSYIAWEDIRLKKRYFVWIQNNS
jgi:hypothetical protein